ncbi:MAG: hypothetical protein D6786_07850 [Gammaproteobacteria bacterium]|nr:MAG: hypothetical protein D6786_07850 [Gammaproteobacteria bacterium]
MSDRTFSESWYQVADLRLALLPSVSVHKQNFRGQDWFILRDTLNDRFFRIRPEAYRFVMSLTPSKTVEECWEECLRLRPETTPGQEEVIRLLSQLHASNLLYFSNRPDSAQIFQRASRTRRKEVQGRLLAFLFVRIPLWDPDRWLELVAPAARRIFSTKGLIVWVLVLLLGAMAVISNIDTAVDQAQGMMAPDNLVLVYLGMLILKLFHELGHAMMCKRFGGSVHTMGVMFLVFTPLPYMDATASWSFRNRWHRILVGGAGMMVELFFAALAAVIWSRSGDGLIHSLAFNMMIIGSVSSLFFNGNPLLRFDAYYMLSDALGIPNLYRRARDQWYYLVEHYLFGVEEASSPGESLRESILLALYGLASLVYRVVITVGIAVFVSDRWFAIGVLVVLVTFYSWVVRPAGRFVMYLATSTRLQRVRKRAAFVSASLISFAAILLFLIPFSSSIRTQGIVQADPFIAVHSGSSGILRRIHIRSGEKVSKGTVLLEFENPELDIDIRLTRAKVEEVQALRDRALHDRIADLKPIEARLSLLRDKLKQYRKQQQQLLIRAEHSGVWVSHVVRDRIGTWFHRGELLGHIVSEGSAHFLAIVSQEDASVLFARDQDVQNHGVKLWGAADVPLAVSNVSVIPYKQTKLPSAALGWFGGGDVAVTGKDKSGREAKEPFFEVIAQLDSNDRGVRLYQGRTGVLYIDLPRETLANRMIRGLSQILQKRYHL